MIGFFWGIFAAMAAWQAVIEIRWRLNGEHLGVRLREMTDVSDIFRP